MGIYAGGTANPISDEAVANKDHLLKFVQKFPTEINPTMWTKMITDVLDRIGKKPSDVARYFFTQININGIRATMENLGEPMDKAHTIMDRYGYTGSACIPMALAEVDEQGKLKAGDLVVFMGSGGGLAFACSVFRW
jgi:3-oxoacyl-[acyl-carrier-protein] synthase-3